VVTKERILFFDLLRIAAISLVVLTHIIGYLGDYRQTAIWIAGTYVTTFGELGVSIFLFVSGCVAAYNVPELNTPGQVKDFMLRRLARIYPAYWCSLFLAILLYVLYYLAYHDFRLSGLSPWDYLLSFSGFQAFFGQWGGRINGVGWFIGLIVCLYLLYPALLYAFEKNKAGTLLALFLISYGSRALIQRYDPIGFYDTIRWMPLCNLFEFGLGIYIVKAGIYPRAPTRSRTIALLGDLSFYVFLIHLPLLYLLKVSVALYVFAVFASSYVFRRFDHLIQAHFNLSGAKQKLPAAPVKQSP
jgi:peptidoglycan/LPS O-acetylase OafA/YrhL